MRAGFVLARFILFNNTEIFWNKNPENKLTGYNDKIRFRHLHKF